MFSCFLLCLLGKLFHIRIKWHVKLLYYKRHTNLTSAYLLQQWFHHIIYQRISTSNIRQTFCTLICTVSVYPFRNCSFCISKRSKNSPWQQRGRFFVQTQNTGTWFRTKYDNNYHKMTPRTLDCGFLMQTKIEIAPYKCVFEEKKQC